MRGSRKNSRQTKSNSRHPPQSNGQNTHSGNPKEKRPMKRYLPLIVCPVLLGFQVQAQFIEITAEIESLGYRLDEPNAIPRTKRKTLQTTCVVGTNQWYIESDYGEPAKWRFDGTNVTSNPSDLAAHINSADGVNKAMDERWLLRQGHPVGDYGVNMPWTAFCSGTFLKAEGRIIPLPANILRHCPDRFAYTDITTTFDDVFGLPRTIDLFTSSARFLESHTQWDKDSTFGSRYTEWNEKTAKKILDGVLVFHYAVAESTNLLGRNFPTKFEFFQIGRRYEENGNWFCQGTGRVKSIRPTATMPSIQ